MSVNICVLIRVDAVFRKGILLSFVTGTIYLKGKRLEIDRKRLQSIDILIDA